MTITNGYCTLADIKHPNVLNIDSSDSFADDFIEGIIEAVSRNIDDVCNRVFFADSDETIRYYSAYSPTQVFTDDMCSPSSDIALDVDLGDGTYGLSFSAVAFVLAPYNAEQQGIPYSKIEISDKSTYLFPVRVPKAIRITSKFGWSSIPKPIINACILQSTRVFKRYATPLGSESMTALGQMTLKIPELDPDVCMLISRYKKVVFG